MMKKRHYMLIGSLVGIPFASELILITMQPKISRESITPVSQPKIQTAYHTIACFTQCSAVSNDTSLHNITEKILHLLNPYISCKNALITSYQSYTIALLEELYLAIYSKENNTLYIDCYSYHTGLKLDRFIKMLEQALKPTKVDILCTDLQK